MPGISDGLKSKTRKTEVTHVRARIHKRAHHMPVVELGLESNGRQKSDYKEPFMPLMSSHAGNSC